MPKQSAVSGLSAFFPDPSIFSLSVVGKGYAAVRLFAICFAVLFAALLPRYGSAQQINFNSFNLPGTATANQMSAACPAGTNILFCINYAGAGPSFYQDFYAPVIDPNAATDGASGSTNYSLLLNQNSGSQTSSVWYSLPQDVVDGFTTWYAVKINFQPSETNGFTADGLAFVIQNALGGQSTGTSPEDPAYCFETGSGPSVIGSGGGCLGYGGIDNSVALEMDTFWDTFDPQDFNQESMYDDNHIALQSCGLDGNGNPIANSPVHLGTPNCLVTLGYGTSTLVSNPVNSGYVSPIAPASFNVNLSDGNPHQVVMIYNGPHDLPANYLWVYLDPTFNPGTHTPVNGSIALFSGPFDITKYMKLSNGGGGFNPAYVGFTAATGGDWEQHEVMGWTFTPHANQTYFGPVNVCPTGQTAPAPCSETFSFTYNFPNGATLAAPQVVTQGVSGLDFQLNPAQTTCTGSVAPGSCTVSVTFAPLAPGSRMGAIQLTTSAGVPVATTLISGVGQAPAVAFGSGAQTVVASDLTAPYGTATDASGNVFITDNVGRRVLKVAPDGTSTPVGGTFNYPAGVAVDGAGNVFVADLGAGKIIEVPSGCVSCQTPLANSTVVGQQTGVAVDGTGDLFFTSLNPAQVSEIPAGCTTVGCVRVLWTPPAGSGTSQPEGIAVDAAGDLFIADGALNQVLEIPAGCVTTSCQVKIGAGWAAPTGVAVDAAGDVFVSDANLGVYEVPSGCSNSACRIRLFNGAGSFGVAVDAQGNVIVPQNTTTRVFKINRSQSPSFTFATTLVNTTSTDSPQSINLQNIGNQPLAATLSGLVTLSGLNFVGVAGTGDPADCSTVASLTPGSSCNLSVAFTPHVTGSSLAGTAVFSDNALNAVPAVQTINLSGTGILVPLQLNVSVLGGSSGAAGAVTDNSGLIDCSAVSVGQAGTCSGSYTAGAVITLQAMAKETSIFTGWGGVCASAGTNSTCNVTLSQAANATASFFNENVGSYNVCPAGQPVAGPCSNVAAVTFNLAATTTLGAIQVVTQGATGLDFSLGRGSSCVGTIQSGNSCAVNVNFTPTAPGLRMGAVQMFDSNGNLVASTPVYGTGQEPEIAFGPGTQVTLPANLPAGANGVAVDATGNVFVAHGAGAVKLTPSGVQSTFPLSGLGSNGINDIALDGAGDVYVVDSNNNRVLEIAPNGVQTIVPTTGLAFPSGIKVDGGGNLFITDRDNNRVVKISPSGAQTTVPTNGIMHPYYPAVDAAGDVFFLDNGHQRVVKVTPDGIQSTIPTSGLTATSGLAVDAAGDVFVSDQVLNQIVEITPGGVQTTLTTNGLSLPAGLAVDAAGNVFIAVNGQNRVVKVVRSQPPSLSFAVTNVGSTSTDSPRSVTLQNIGNQPLSGAQVLNLGANFTQNPASTCSSVLALAAGAICNVNFSFTPRSATFAAGTALFSDNNLNFIPSAQTITLSGTGATNGVAGTVAVPNVIGQVQSAASAPISAVGLVLGTMSTASSSTVPSGSVISQSPDPATQVAVGSAVNLLVSSGIAQPPSPNPLTFENNYFVTGDYVSAGVTLRGKGVAGLASGSIVIPSFAQDATNGVPDGADVVDAFLYWETLENTPFASSASGTFNGYPIVGQQIGNDLPNYVDGQVTGTVRSYRAAVNAYLPIGANGVRIASGTYKVSLPDGGGSTLPLTEGASLVMVYRVLSPNFPLKSVVIYDGAAAPSVSATQVVKGFYDAAGGANGTGKNTNLYASNSVWNNNTQTSVLGSSTQFNATLNAVSAYAAVIFSTRVNNSDNDGILDAWKTGPAAGDFHTGQPGYYDTKTGTWVGLPGAKHGQKDLFVQLDYMCGAVLNDGSCDTAKENLFPSPDASGNDPLAMVQQAFTNSGVHLHLQIGNAVPESTCADDLTPTPSTLCQFPNQPGVVGWKNSLEFSKLYPRNLLACITGGDCTTRFPYGQKDSYHYVLMGHSLAIPAWNTRYGTLTSINVSNGVTTIGTVDRGSSTTLNYCPSRITLAGVLGNPSLNGVYNTTKCADSKTITVATPGVPNWSYPNSNLPEPVIGLTSGTISSISGYSDLGGADSAVTLGLWLTAPNQDMSKKANVLAGTIFHEIGHTLGLGHGGLYYDTPGSYVPTFDANCKPNYQSVMNYLFQLDLLGPNQTLAFSNQTLSTLNEGAAGMVKQLTDDSSVAATFPTSAWYVPYTSGSPVSPATRHCDGTPLTGDLAYRVDSSIAPISPSWSNGQDLSFLGTVQTAERGFNDLANMDLRQIGATGGQFAALASVLSFGSSVAPLNIGANGNVTLGSGGTVALGSGGTVTLGSGGNVTLGSGGTVTLGSGGNITLGSGGNVTLGSGGTVTPGSGGTVTLGSGGNVTLGSGGTITLGSGGVVTLELGGNVTLGSGGLITLGSGGTPVTIPSSGGSYSIDAGGTITLGSGGNVTLGSGGNVTLGSGGVIALGSGGNVTLGSGGNVTLGSGGTITLGSGGTVALGSGGNVTLGSGGTIALGSGGTVTLGSGGNVTLGSGGTVTLGSGGNVALGSGGNVTLGSGGSATLGAGGTVTLGSGGTVTLGSGGNVTLGSGGTIALGSGGNVTLGSGGVVALGSGGTITLGSGGTVTLGSGGTITLGSGGTIAVPAAGGTYPVDSGATISLTSAGNVTLGSGGNVTLGSGGTIALGSGGNVTLGSGGTIALGSGGTVTLGSGGNVTLGSGGVVTLGSGGTVTEGSGSEIGLGTVSNITPASGGPSAANEMTYETANSVVRPPALATETSTPIGIRINWKAPAFGVVQTYTINRSVDGAGPIVIGSVSGINGNPPATEFTDTNPVLNATVVYTITTTLVPDAAGPARQSVPSPPAVTKNDQSIVLGALPGAVLITSSPTVTATAMAGNAPSGLQVAFSASGTCSIGSQSLANNISTATVILLTPGNCTVTAAQPGSTAFNAANSVSATFTVLAKNSTIVPQTINFATLPNVQYGGSFTLSASSSSGQLVSFQALGPCTSTGGITGVGVCFITASAPASATVSAASVTQSFNIFPAVLKVMANNLNVAYALALPSLTYTYGPFVKGEGASVVSGAPVLSTTAVAGSNAGSYPIKVSTGTLAAANYSFLYVTGALTIQPANQAALILKTSSPLTFNQGETLGVTGGTTAGTVTYKLISGPCTVLGNRLTANGGTGSCQVTATMAGTGNYNPVTSAASVVSLSPASQTITFTKLPPASATYGSSFAVAANSTSGGAVNFSSAGSCSNSGATYTVTSSTGTCSVIANQAGNSNYSPAAPVIKGVSATGPLVRVSASTIDFGTVYYGSISLRTITLTNIGTAPVTIKDPILSIVRGGNSNEFIALSLCPKPLAAGKSCSVTVFFLAGPYYTTQTATLQIMSDAPGSPQSITLSAMVINPQASLSQSSLNFGTVKRATSSVLNVTLSNPGGTPLTLSGISLKNASGTTFVQSNTCGSSLAPGARCIVAVKFTPATSGTFSGSLTFVDNAQARGGTQTVSLSGTGN